MHLRGQIMDNLKLKSIGRPARRQLKKLSKKYLSDSARLSYRSEEFATMQSEFRAGLWQLCNSLPEIQDLLTANNIDEIRFFEMYGCLELLAGIQVGNDFVPASVMAYPSLLSDLIKLCDGGCTNENTGISGVTAYKFVEIFDNAR